MSTTQQSTATDFTHLGATTAIAVSYLRVSTKEQAERGGRDEGFSIPAQREANLRKARDLGSIVVEEFVDAGESARKADRPELMRMIEYVKTNHVAYCIVHKVDRLARNRADDVAIHVALKDAGVMLVSATENIDETPSGDAAPRHHVHHRRVLLPQPRQRSLKGHEPKSDDRWHQRKSTHWVSQRDHAR